MAEPLRLICASADLAEGAAGVRFDYALDGDTQPAFAVRYNGIVHAYLNRCAHISVELDFNPGEFFDESGLFLICATHGAMYEADTGECAGGPCAGKGLYKLSVLERDGNVYVVENKTLERAERKPWLSRKTGSD